MSDPSSDPLDIHHLEAQRRANRDQIAALNLNPYGRRVDGVVAAEEAKTVYSAEADAAFSAGNKTPGFVDPRPRVTVAGRVMLNRDNGKLVWLNLRDHTGDVQVAVSQRDCAGDGFALAKATDLGDLLVAHGRVMKTKTGEVTIWAEGLEPGAKCLAPPPAKHDGLADIEIRYRQRYVDLWANPQTLRVFTLRSKIVARIRRFLGSRGYLEVETPMLQALAGGAAARPFVTHMNALDMSLFMRIAPELYLKRLLVGGLPKVFEINRNFRNEGLDKQHNPEFTTIEAYHAYGDCETVMELTESCVRDVAGYVSGEADYLKLTPTTDAEARQGGGGSPPREGETLRAGAPLVLPFGEYEVDYGAPFARVTYAELFERALGFPTGDTARCRKEASRRRLFPEEAIGKLDPILIVNELFEEVAEGSLDPSKPTFITEYPAALSPLTRPKPGNPAVAERADFFVGRMEVGPHYTELNDPDVQEAKFREQLGGLDTEKAAEENTFRTMDHDFLRALKVGMPPAGGMGLGIDRLVMLLTNQRTIRDVVLFPLMRPEDRGAE